jgi:hypothetical protein
MEGPPGREPPEEWGLGGEIGATCIPASEHSPQYAGSSFDQVALDSAAICGMGVCLLDHFQGRVTCAYGQNAEQIASLPAADPARCRVPDEIGNPTATPVEVEVLPQLLLRIDDQAVYCSCPCAGPEANKQYCTCPDNMDCVELIPPTGDPATDIYAGSYCVRRESPYDASVDRKPCILGDPDAVEPCGEANP